MTLWLDDIRKPWLHGYVGAEWEKTADEAIAILKTGRVEYASLDHDLSEAATMGMAGPNEKTGYTVVCFLEANPELWPPQGVKVHSMNPVGAIKMRAVIEAHYKRRFDSLEMHERQVKMAEGK